MSTKKVTPAKKTVKPKVTLKQLISRTEKIADDVTKLLGDLRKLDQQGFVIATSLESGSTKVPNA